MAANVLIMGCSVVEGATAILLETAINAELTTLSGLNLGPDGQALGANILSVSTVSTVLPSNDAVNLVCTIIYSYYGPAS